MASSAQSLAAKDELRLSSVAARSSLLWQPETAGKTPVIRLFGVSLFNTLLDTAVRELILSARYGRRMRVVFVNAHVVNEMSADEAYRATVTSADRLYADGSGLAVAARLAGTPLADNINGTDVLPRLARSASESEVGIFLLGSAPGVADGAALRLNDMRIGGAIVGTHHGHFSRNGADEDAIIEAINHSGAKIVLVGLGVPLQDKWIAANAHRLTAPVVIGVGGLFDYFAGRVSRAPVGLRSIGLEWAWRLALEPRRLAKRYLWGNFAFMGRAVREAMIIRRSRNTASV